MDRSPNPGIRDADIRSSFGSTFDGEVHMSVEERTSLVVTLIADSGHNSPIIVRSNRSRSMHVPTEKRSAKSSEASARTPLPSEVLSASCPSGVIKATGVCQMRYRLMERGGPRVSMTAITVF